MLEKLIADLRKEFGTDAVVTDIQYVKNVIPTGSITLDKAIGVGGYPEGRIVELFGAESSGKSTMCLHAAMMTQQLDKGCVYIDAENVFDKVYAERLGVNLDPEHFILIQPNSAEEALGIVEIAAQDSSVGLIVIDSVAAMVPTKEAFGAGEVGDSHVGLMARLMTQWVRRITPIMKNKSECTIILVNQVREQISSSPFAATHTPGGHALKHAASIRIKLARKATIKSDGKTGINVIAKVIKNKVAPPYTEAEFHIIGGEGIDTTREIVELLVANKKISRAGSWYKTLDGESIGQNTSSVLDWINSNQATVVELLKEEGLSEIYAGNNRDS